MNIVVKKFELVEIYIEDKSRDVVKEAVKNYRKQGFGMTDPVPHYGKKGREEDKMWYTKGTKKMEIKQ